MWGYSSVGRASALQAEGHRFDPVYLHHHDDFFLWGYSSVGRASALQAEGHRFDPVYLHHHDDFFLWGYSSVGRASALQAEGHRFDPVYLHHLIIYGVIAQLGERLHGMQEVTGSIPVSSTITPFQNQLLQIVFVVFLILSSIKSYKTII